MKNALLIICLAVCFVSCEEEYYPKPKSYLALEFPPHRYQPINVECPFQFEVNKISNLKSYSKNKHCWFNVNYPSMDATIYITYQQVNQNLKELLIDAQNLPLKHTIKAEAIDGNTYTNPSRKTYGSFYKVSGDAASQAQFYLTDSIQHFLTGAIYFRRKPNYDSILPAADYIQKDIKHLMESVQWKD